MIDDPYTYDLSEFSRHFTWGMMFWNSAEYSAKQMLAELLGGGAAALAVAVDMANRSVLNGIEAAARENAEPEMRGHLAHFSKGFGIMLGYRNMFAHNLKGVAIHKTVGMNRIMTGAISQIKAEGRLKFVHRPVSMEEIENFCENSKSLSQYATAILHELGMEDLGIAEMLGMPPPSLEKPEWPAALKNTPSYLQE